MSLFTRLRTFARATGGLAALEFALISPMMVFLLFGSVEVIDALQANRRAENTAASIADVVARDTEISDAEVTGIWASEGQLLYPDPSSAMDIRVTSIMVNSTSDARVVWSEVHNGYSALAANTKITTLPTNMMVAGSSLIMTETVFHYAPPLHFLFTANVDIHHTAYRRSRLVDPIPRVS